MRVAARIANVRVPWCRGRFRNWSVTRVRALRRGATSSAPSNGVAFGMTGIGATEIG